MTKIVCDICGKDIENRQDHKVSIESNCVTCAHYQVFKYTDICDNCQTSIVKHINTLMK